MKRFLLPLLTAALLAPIAHAQRIATVDMNKIFSSYYKTKDAESKINEARTTAKGELDERIESYKKNLDSLNKLDEELQKP